MFKKMLLVSAILAATTGIAFANAAPYAGAGLGIVNNTTSSYPYASSHSMVYTHPSNFRGIPFNLFAGYGGVITQNFYLGGELFGTVATAEISDDHGLKTSYGYGASILPGYMLTDHTLAFVRGGVVRTHFSDIDQTQTGGQLGLGLQTTVTQNVDVRGEYDYTAYRSLRNSISTVSSPRSDAFNIALVYKFD